MARYKHIETSPRFVAIDPEWQLLPSTFEHPLHHLIGDCGVVSLAEPADHGFPSTTSA